MRRPSIGSAWLQSIVVLAVIAGVFAGDISVAQARVAANHKREAARQLHRAQAAYAAQIDTISRTLFTSLQPVQNALDSLDATRPQYLDAGRDAVVNSRTSAAITRLDVRLMRVRPPTSFASQHGALHAALIKMGKSLKALERAKKSKDASDLLDEPYSNAAFDLTEAEDSWATTLQQLDTSTHRAEAPSPGSVGTARPHAALAPSKASWIFGADHACYTAGHAIYRLPDINASTSEASLLKTTDQFAGIMSKVSRDLRAVPVPAADRTYLRRGVLRSLSADDAFAQAYRQFAQSLRRHDVSILNEAIAKEHAAEKGMSTLAHQMTAYGAEFCGYFFDPHAKPSDKNGGSSGISA